MRAILGLTVFLCACSPAEQGEPGDQGPQGTQGPQGPIGPMGDLGPSGTAGQDIIEVVSTGQLVIVPTQISFVQIPGMFTTVTVPASSKVRVHTDGGLQCTLPGNAYSAVDVAIFVDGLASSPAGQRRVIAANSAAVGNMIASWSFERVYTLSPGSHTFEVRAASGDMNSATANVGSGSAPQIQAVLQVTVLRQ